MSFPQKRYSGLLLKYLKPHWSQALLLFFFLLCNISLALVNPQIISSFIAGISTGAAMQALITMALLFLVVAFLKQGVAIIEGYVAENLSQRATNSMRSDLMLHCLRLDPAFHTSHTPGELIERIDGDVSTLGNFFSRFIVSLFGNLLLLIGVLVLLFRIDWRAGLLLSLFAAVAMLIMYRLRSLATPYWEKERQSGAELFGFVEERLAGTEDIRSSGANAYVLRGLAERARARLHAARKAMQNSFISWEIPSIFFAAGNALSLALGAYLLLDGTITIATVYLIFSYTNLLNEPLQQIINQLRDFQQAGGSIKRITDLLAWQSKIKDGNEHLPEGPLTVEFADVSFSYVEHIPVLKHVSFTLTAGTVMGLLGRTGSGKSTITRLITRLYDPAEGVVCLGGKDIRDLRVDDLRKSIGMVAQEVQILHATVRDNLTLFDPGIADKKIIQAINELGLGAWYESLPQGLDTKLAPGGSGLSAGEAQLISFARVFLKDPRLVILDEASSRLDPATERRLEQAISRLLRGRTGIIIAHRLATILRADTILILEDGQCREYGPREALASDEDSRFAHLLRTGLEEVLV
jgi:ATP-binding cassette subfamily B protein